MKILYYLLALTSWASANPLAATGCPSSKLQKIGLSQQEGFPQVVEFVTPVPTLDDFTVCYWMKSVNLTYRHTTFSYAAPGSPQAISIWIEPTIYGTTVNMVISGQEVHSIPFQILQHRWNHFCHSWEGSSSQWLLYVNGDIVGQGFTDAVPRVSIPGGGVLSAGQQEIQLETGPEGKLGFEKTYGVEGEMTLIFFDSRPLRASLANVQGGPNFSGELVGVKQVHDISYVTAGVKQLGRTCLEHLPGNIVAWSITDMKLYGGARIMLAKPSCGDF